jgi:bromodomain adjacent to zinc finger domain protein 1B
MAPKQKKRKLQSEDSTKSEEVDEEKKMVEEAKVLSC